MLAVAAVSKVAGCVAVRILAPDVLFEKVLTAAGCCGWRSSLPPLGGINQSGWRVSNPPMTAVDSEAAS
jgi:hypothetical protein